MKKSNKIQYNPNKAVVSELAKFAGFIYDNFLDQYVDENLRRVKTMDIPLLKLFSHLSEEQFREMNIESARRFLHSLEQGTALQEASERLKEWKEDRLPGIKKDQIHPSDLILIYSLQRRVLIHFLPFYSNNSNLIIQIIEELEEYHAEVQKNSIMFLFQLQKDIELDLKKKHTQLEEAQSIAHIGSWDYDVKNDNVVWSKEMFRIFEMPIHHIPVSQDVIEILFSHLDTTVLDQEFYQHAKAGEQFQYESELQLKSGKRITLLIRGQAEFDDNGNIVRAFGTSQDITEIKLAQIEKELSERKDEFIGIASHELKTPVTSINLYLDLILQFLTSPDPEGKIPLITKHTIKCKDALQKLTSLISDLLDSSKMEAGEMKLKMEEINLKDLIDDGVENIRYLSPKHIVHVDGESNFLIHGDKQRLEQVLMNFLSNAIKYSPDSQEITLSTKKEASEIIIGVTDFGIGIGEDNKKNIFERYFRVSDTSHRFSGLGLGLYISQQIIRKHKGKVWVESELGKGSTFYFSIPC